ncbi:MAG: response regulator [Acidobacteriia bacterium]|nr:response regulator [Terriglobia bacterium]
MKRIRVLIVEDSAVVRELLRRIISADGRFEIAGAVPSAEEALRGVHALAPDVISLDLCLPGMQGEEATRRIMSERPTPIVVVSGALESAETNRAMNALKAGALAVVEKPPATGHGDYEAIAGQLCTQLAIMSEVKVVRQQAPPEWMPAAPAVGQRPPVRYKILGVAASTGGPGALMTLLGGLGSGFPLPVVAVQHMTPAFLSGFANWLGSVVPLPVAAVTKKTRMEPGTVYVTGEMRHLLAAPECVWTEEGRANGHCPSATALFDSLARHAGGAAIGVLLTGMGEDGAQGLLNVRRAGGYTIVEDASTAVVNGMPAAGLRLGAAIESLPLPAIAPRILRLVNKEPAFPSGFDRSER